MASVKDVIVRNIAPVYKRRDGFMYESFKGHPAMQVTVVHGKNGIVFGNHFHKGEDPSKNPEKVFLINGKLQLYCDDGNEEINRLIEVSSEIEIPAGILHRLIARTDDVFFLEYRLTPYDNRDNDTYPAHKFRDFIRGQNVEG